MAVEKTVHVYDSIHRKTWRRELAAQEVDYKPEDYTTDTNLRSLAKWVARVSKENKGKRFFIYAVCTENSLSLKGESGKAEMYTIDDPEWFAKRLETDGDKVAIEGFIMDLDEFLDNSAYDWSPLEV